MQWIREQDLYKRPGIAETIDWAHALCTLGVDDLDQKTIDATLGCILKYQRDIEKIHGHPVLDQVRRGHAEADQHGSATAS
jgi:hypothetical protein